MSNASPELNRSWEAGISESIERARERIGEAERAIGEPAGASESRALEQARGLVRSLEALGDRLPGEQGEQGEQTEGGEQGEEQQGQGQQGQGQQGQGQQGQGQQGQGQQGQGQQGQGQQGQGQQGQGGERGEGQGGQQGQQGQGGQQQSAGGRPGGAGQGAPGGRGGQMSPDEARQLQREYGARRLDAEALRRELQQSGADVASLNEWIQRLRELERGRSFDDAEELTRLHGAVVEGMKAYEFALRRALETGDDRPLLDARGEVPPGFKALVEEYYKSLARPR